MYVYECRHCAGCTYNRPYCGKGSTFLPACHYLLDTGKMRGCSVEKCTRYTPKEAATQREYMFNKDRFSGGLQNGR